MNDDAQLPAGHELMSARSLRAMENTKRRARAGSRPDGLAGLAVFDHDDGLIEPSSWDGRKVPSREWIVDGLLPAGCVTLLTGEGGKGKSHLAMQLLISAATGSTWCGKPVGNVMSLGIFCEDDQDEIQRRMADILNEEGARFSDLEGWSTVMCRLGRDNIMFEGDKFERDVGRMTHFFDRVRYTVRHMDARLLVLDSLYNFYGGDEINRAQALQFLNGLASIATDINGSVVLLAHPSVAGINSGSGISGSTAWHNAVRSRLYLHHRKCKDGEEPDQWGNGPLVLKSMKSNYGAPPAEIQLKRKGARFVTKTESMQAPEAERSLWRADQVCADLLDEGYR